MRCITNNLYTKNRNNSFLNYWKRSEPFKFRIYDVVLSGIFLSFFLGISFLLKRSIFIGKLNIGFEIPFYIIFGIILGPIKGTFLAFLADFFDVLLRGRIVEWTLFYAIIPPLVALIAWMYFYIFTKKNKIYLLIPIFSLLIAIITMLLVTYFQEKPRVENIDKTIKKYFTKELILILSSITFFVVITTTTILFVLYYKTHKEVYKLLIFIISCITTLIIIFRWLWGPIAFIDYWNRFLNRSGKPERIIQEYYWFYLTPIIVKGSITIPIYCMILMPLIPLLLKLNNKHNKIAIQY